MEIKPTKKWNPQTVVEILSDALSGAIMMSPLSEQEKKERWLKYSVGLKLNKDIEDG